MLGAPLDGQPGASMDKLGIFTGTFVNEPWNLFIDTVWSHKTFFIYYQDSNMVFRVGFTIGPPQQT